MQGERNNDDMAQRGERSPLRIALVAEGWDESSGGAARIATRLASTLERRGHEVSPVGPPDGGGRIRRARVLSHRAERAGGEHDIVVSLGKAKGHVLIPQGGTHLGALMASVESEWAPLRAPNAAAKLFSMRHWVLLKTEQQSVKSARRVVALSERIRDDMVRYWGLDRHKIAVIPNGVCSRSFRPATGEERATARAELGLADDERCWLFCSHNWRLRGLLPLIHALGRAPAKVREREVLLVVGRGRGYEGAARRHGVRLHATGAVPNILSLLHAADALVHPTFYDPCSLVTLEALASGLPVLTSRRNGASELWSGAEGELINDPGAPGEIALALQRLRDAPARAERARAARSTALSYPEAEALGRLADLIERTATDLAAEGAQGSVAAAAGSR